MLFLSFQLIPSSGQDETFNLHGAIHTGLWKRIHADRGSRSKRNYREVADFRTAAILIRDSKCFHCDSVTHSSVNHNENMQYPVWKSCGTGVRNLSFVSTRPRSGSELRAVQSRAG